MQYRVPPELAEMTDEQVREEMNEFGYIGPGDSHPDVRTVKTAVGYAFDRTDLYDAPFEMVVRSLRERQGMDDSPFIEPMLVQICSKHMTRSRSIL